MLSLFVVLSNFDLFAMQECFNKANEPELIWLLKISILIAYHWISFCKKNIITFISHTHTHTPQKMLLNNQEALNGCKHPDCFAFFRV